MLAAALLGLAGGPAMAEDRAEGAATAYCAARFSGLSRDEAGQRMVEYVVRYKLPKEDIETIAYRMMRQCGFLDLR